MLDFNEELKRFKPSPELDNIEDTIAATNLTDVSDILISLLSSKDSNLGKRK